MVRLYNVKSPPRMAEVLPEQFSQTAPKAAFKNQNNSQNPSGRSRGSDSAQAWIPTIRFDLDLPSLPLTLIQADDDPVSIFRLLDGFDYNIRRVTADE